MDLSGTDDEILRAAAEIGQSVAVAVVERVLAAAQLSDAQRVAAALALARAVRPAPEPTQVSVFRREGEFWTLEHGGELARLHHCRGLLHLSRLLAQPGQPVHVLDLVHAAEGGAGVAVADPSMGAVLDPSAKSAYRRRLSELDEEVEDARSCADPARIERATAEREFVLLELSRALGLGGRDRTTGSAAERARVAVTKSVRAAMSRIDAHHASLGDHLRMCVRTGTFCCYSADPGVRWRT